MNRFIILFLSFISYTAILTAQTPEEDVAIGRELASTEKYDSAFLHFLSAAEHGSVEGMYEVGKLYDQGLGTDSSITEAFKWYKRAVDSGYGKALLPIGIIYHKRGFEKEAIDCLDAAIKYDKGAYAALGNIYYAREDYPNAFDLFTLAAKNGDAQSMYYLGEMYYDGNGVKPDEAKALSWFRKAAKKGNKAAIEYLDDLGYEVSPSKKTEPEKRKYAKDLEEAEKEEAE